MRWKSWIQECKENYINHCSLQWKPVDDWELQKIEGKIKKYKNPRDYYRDLALWGMNCIKELNKNNALKDHISNIEDKVNKIQKIEEEMKEKDMSQEEKNQKLQEIIKIFDEIIMVDY